MQADLEISYFQVGLLLGLPAVVSTFIEPFIMLCGDTRWRKHLVIAGGLGMVLSLSLIASAPSFSVLLLAFALAFPASGAFVSLSQATLVDMNPGGQSHIMARWTLVGSIGSLAGFMLASLASDALVLPLLNRYSGRSVVRLSALGVAFLYLLWLISPWVGVKVGLLFIFRLVTLGWYPVLKGEAYASLLGRSGTVMAVSSLAGLIGAALTWFIGWYAGWMGLNAAMWLLLFAPVCLVLFVRTPEMTTIQHRVD